MPPVSPRLGSAPIQRVRCVFLVDACWVLGFFGVFLCFGSFGVCGSIVGRGVSGSAPLAAVGGSVRPAKVTWTIDPFMVSLCKTALNQRVIFTMFSPAWCVQHTILEFNNCMLSSEGGGQS